MPQFNYLFERKDGVITRVQLPEGTTPPASILWEDGIKLVDAHTTHNSTLFEIKSGDKIILYGPTLKVALSGVDSYVLRAYDLPGNNTVRLIAIGLVDGKPHQLSFVLDSNVKPILLTVIGDGISIPKGNDQSELTYICKPTDPMSSDYQYVISETGHIILTVGKGDIIRVVQVRRNNSSPATFEPVYLVETPGNPATIGLYSKHGYFKII